MTPWVFLDLSSSSRVAVDVIRIGSRTFEVHCVEYRRNPLLKRGTSAACYQRLMPLMSCHPLGMSLLHLHLPLACWINSYGQIRIPSATAGLPWRMRTAPPVRVRRDSAGATLSTNRIGRRACCPQRVRLRYPLSNLCRCSSSSNIVQ